MKEEIQKLIESSISIKKLLLQDQLVISSIEDLANRSLLALQNDGKIILAGNGGSFGDAWGGLKMTECNGNVPQGGLKMKECNGNVPQGV